MQKAILMAIVLGFLVSGCGATHTYSTVPWTIPVAADWYRPDNPPNMAEIDVLDCITTYSLWGQAGSSTDRVRINTDPMVVQCMKYRGYIMLPSHPLYPKGEDK